MLPVPIDPAIREKCPRLTLDILRCKLTVSGNNPALWQYIEKVLVEIRTKYTVDEISKIHAIRKAREAYKSLGKDPSRYRPSAEALLRRVLQGKDLYRVNNAIDILNIISIRSGISIGGYDEDKIQGSISLSVAGENIVYHGIGKGLLNIEYLPVLQDSAGFFGNPTSDSERTCVTEKTENFLMVFFNFEGSPAVREWLEESIRLLMQYAQAKEGNLISGELSS
jgi:DNA/RNA-binding domain of Phe-tRNA-synthetase-like protein